MPRLPVYGAMAATSPSSGLGRGLGHLPPRGKASSQQKPADFLRQSPQFLPGQGLICRQSRQLLLHAGNLVRRNADARQLLFRERRPCVPAVTRPAGQCPKSALPFCIPPAVFLHYSRRRRKKPEKSQSKGGVYRTVKSFLCRQGRGASGTLDVLLCFGSMNLCLLPKNWSVRLQFQKKCLFCCRKIV